jgi:signal transduction histidine kinase
MTAIQETSRPFRWLPYARKAWVALFVVACGILLASLPGFARLFREGLHSNNVLLTPGPMSSVWTGLTVVIAVTVALGSLTLAWLLYRRGATDPMALFVAFYLLLHAVSTAGPIEALEPFLPGAANFNVFVLQPLIFIPLTALLYATFPDGRFVPKWMRWAVAVVCVLTVPITVLLVSPSGLEEVLATTSSLTFIPLTLVTVGLGGLFFYAQIYRYRKVSTPEQRQQTKWVLYGIGVWFSLVALSSPPWMYLQNLPPGSTLPSWVGVSTVLWALATAVIPTTLAIAILRYRLYDIDLIINRTLVYGALTALVIGLYVLAIAAFGALFQSNLLIAVLATAIAAILFQPLRARLQRGVNRLMYGERDDPYAVLARLGRRLEVAQEPEATLSTAVETIAQTLRLPYVSVVSGPGDDPAVVASYGLASASVHSIPLTYRGETFGALRVARRSPSDDFTPAEHRLLEDLARQVSVIARSVQLTADLRRARLQLVTSREEERRRLRRDLHDGLGPSLAALNLQVGAVLQKLHDDPFGAEVLVGEWRQEIRATIDEVRRLVYGLRPPALDELGLIDAIRSSADQANRARPGDDGLTVEVHAPGPLPPLPAAVEVAAYRIVREAVANVVRHAQAHRCTVSLHCNDELEIMILDDGVGLPTPARRGVGMISMRERAEELGGTLSVERLAGGGTRVTARLPLGDSPS